MTAREVKLGLRKLLLGDSRGRILRAAVGALALAAFTTECGGEPDRKRRPSDDDGGEGGSPNGAGGCATCAGKAGAASTHGGSAGSAPSAGRGGSPTAGAGSGGNAGKSGRGGSSAQSGDAGASASAGLAANGGTRAGDGGTSDGGSTGVTSLTITKVALYQATEVTLFERGDDAELNAPIVADRAAELRVFLRREAGFVAHDIVGYLTFSGKRGARGSTVTKRVSADSTSGELDSTLNFSISELDLGEDNTIRIELQEAADASVVLDAWPRSGTTELTGSSTGGPFRVTLVPLVSGGFTPELSTTIVERFESHLEALYPISSVELSVREPHTLSSPVLGDDYGTGWDMALSELYQLRFEDGAPPNEYYYGVLTPGESMDDYCPVACVVGLAMIAEPNDEEYRGAIGTGFFESATDTYSQETLEHELGHALGRDHAPCGASDTDPNFPYARGDIGVWGWDGARLRAPDEDTDLMSYCSPVWVSDYTFDGLFTRIAYVNDLAARGLSRVGAAPKRARTLVLSPDGSVRWGPERTTRTSLENAKERVELLDAAGRVLDVTWGRLARFDHMPGGFLSMPAEALAKPGVVSVRTKGATLVVP